MKNSLSITLIIFLCINTISNKEDRYKSSISNSRAIASVQEKTEIVTKDKVEIRTDTDATMRIQKSRNKYLEAAKYPSTSSPVDHKKTEDHLMMRYSDKPKFLKVGKTIVKLWSKKLYYKKNKDEVKIFYSLKRDESFMTELTLTGEKLSMTLSPTKINDSTYAVALGANTLPEGDYRVSLKIDNKADVSTSFAVRDHHLEFLKVENDSITSNGDLLFTNRVDVHIAGDYIVEGTLYADGKLIANAEVITTFSKGLQLFDLSFYGKILHDKKIDGKLELKNLTLSFVKPSLASKNLGLITTSYMSSDYTYDQFHNISFDNKLLLDKSRLGLAN